MKTTIAILLLSVAVAGAQTQTLRKPSGPSTAESVPVFLNTDGETVQESAVTIDSAGRVSISQGTEDGHAVTLAQLNAAGGGNPIPEALPADGNLSNSSWYYEDALAATDTWTLPTGSEGSEVRIDSITAAESTITISPAVARTGEEATTTSLVLPVGNNGTVFRFSGGVWRMVDSGWVDTGGSGASDFDSLSDTPADKTGSDGYFVSVSGTNLVYTPASGGGDAYLAGNQTFTGLNTFNAEITAAAGVEVNQIASTSGTQRLVMSAENFIFARGVAGGAFHLFSDDGSSAILEANNTLTLNENLFPAPGTGAVGDVLTKTAKASSDTLEWKKPAPQIYALTIDNAADGMDYGMVYIPADFTVTEIRGVLVNAGTTTITTTFNHQSDRSGVGVAIDVLTVTSTTTGDSITTGFDDATIPAGSWVWIETSAASGSGSNLELVLIGTFD